MSKPVINIKLTTLERKTIGVEALLDTGSFYSIIRQDRLPQKAKYLRYRTPEYFRAAAKGSRLRVVGVTELVMTIGRKRVRDGVLVSPDLSRQMIVGAGTMQKWDIGIRNLNGKTRITVGRDMRDPDTTEVV